MSVRLSVSLVEEIDVSRWIIRGLALALIIAGPVWLFLIAQSPVLEHAIASDRSFNVDSVDGVESVQLHHIDVVFGRDSIKVGDAMAPVRYGPLNGQLSIGPFEGSIRPDLAEALSKVSSIEIYGADEAGRIDLRGDHSLVVLFN